MTDADGGDDGDDAGPRYRCKECGETFEPDRPVPPDRCPNPDCGAKFGGGWADNLARIR